MSSESLASASDRLREKNRQHAALGKSLHARLDAIDKMEGYALPIIDRELAEREYNAQSLENDAKVIERLARDLEGSNSGRPLPKSDGDSGRTEGQGAASADEGASIAGTAEKPAGAAPTGEAPPPAAGDAPRPNGSGGAA